MPSPYNEMQLDALRELANIGSGNAATALSQMLGEDVSLQVPRALALPLADAVDEAGESEAVVTGVVLEVAGHFDAPLQVMGMGQLGPIGAVDHRTGDIQLEAELESFFTVFCCS